MPPPVQQPEMFTRLERLRDALDFKPRCVIDVGANVGRWTERASAIWPDASFLMVEANDMHKHRLEAQLARLQKRGGGGARHAYAIAVLANATGKRSLFVPRPEHRAAAHTGTSLFRQVPSAAKFMREERDVQPLDALAAAHGLTGCGLIKADVQGAEVFPPD